MTTQKLFKRRVRERMSKTGERYTAARRHVDRTRARLAESGTNLAGGAMELASDAKATEATGRNWEAWLFLLDGWGARTRRHGETVEFLMAEHAVSAWYAQAITNGYERARGIRLKHQQPDGFTLRGSQPGKVARFAWGDGKTRVSVTFEAKGAAKSTSAVAHERLADPDEAEAVNAAWRLRLAALKSFVESSATSA